MTLFRFLELTAACVAAGIMLRLKVNRKTGFNCELDFSVAHEILDIARLCNFSESTALNLIGIVWPHRPNRNPDLSLLSSVHPS